MIRRIIKIAYPKDEWIRDFYPTREYLESLDVDIFSFWQRFPDTKPRYYIPLSAKGKVALTLGLHKSLVGSIPEKLKDRLVRLRAKSKMIAVMGETVKWLGL